MVKLGRTKQEDRGRAAKYAAVGRSLLHTARDLDTMGEDKYGNGLAIIVIHAAIAFTDALTVGYGAIKSTDGDHGHAADVLMHALGPSADARQVLRLRTILNAKTDVSYSGTFYTLRDGRELLQEVERYVEWAGEKLVGRPPG